MRHTLTSSARHRLYTRSLIGKTIREKAIYSLFPWRRLLCSTSQHCTTATWKKGLSLFVRSHELSASPCSGRFEFKKERSLSFGFSRRVKRKQGRWWFAIEMTKQRKAPTQCTPTKMWQWVLLTSQVWCVPSFRWATLLGGPTPAIRCWSKRFILGFDSTASEMKHHLSTKLE